MKKFAKVLIVALVFCLVLSIGVISASAVTPEEAAKSVFRVVTDSPTYGWVGETLFAVSGSAEKGVEYFVSTSSIVDYAEGTDIWLLRSRDHLIKLKVDQVLPACELVIFRSRDKLYGVDPLPLASEDSVILGSQEYYSLGFPDVDVADNYQSYASDVTINNGIVSRKTELDGVEVYQTNTDITWGSFGGPMIDGNGNVIAINAFNSGEDGINACTKIDYITDVLSSLGIKYTSASEISSTDDQSTGDDQSGEEASQPTIEPAAPAVQPAVPVAQPAAPVEKKDNTILYIIIGVGALLLIVIIVVLIMLSKKNKPQPTPVAMPQQQAYNNQPMFDAQSETVAIGEEKTVAHTQAHVEQTMAHGATLKCITGKLMGKSIQLSEGVPVSLGRDPKLCQIVFGSDAGAISRKHCTIRYNGSSQTFILEDSSTNGTFLINGKRLEKGKAYTLRDGDKFYLDTKQNTFQVNA